MKIRRKRKSREKKEEEEKTKGKREDRGGCEGICERRKKKTLINEEKWEADEEEIEKGKIYNKQQKNKKKTKQGMGDEVMNLTKENNEVTK